MVLFFQYLSHFGQKWQDPRNKIYWLRQFFTILVEIRQSPRKKNLQEKNFDEIFGLKYVLKHSESIPTKKIVSTNNFWLGHFFTVLAKKWLSPRKIFNGKNFRFRDFRLKIRFKTFWIDSDQKIFFDKIFGLFHFFTILGL